MMYCVPIQNVTVQLIMFSNRFRAYGQCCVFYRFFGVEQGRARRGAGGAFSPPSNFEMEKKWENRAQTKKRRRKKEGGNGKLNR